MSSSPRQKLLSTTSPKSSLEDDVDSARQSSLLVSPSSRRSSSSKNTDHDALTTPTALSPVKISRRPSILDEDEQPTSAAAALLTNPSSSSPSPSPSPSTSTRQKPSKDDDKVTWFSLPKKSQLVILVLARLSEPLAERSLAAYMFYQLRSFDPSLPDSTITSQGGILTAAFAGAQFLTAVWWGRAADTPWIGRKRVLLIGLFGTAVASIGVGFSTSFTQALMFRGLAGALNGNIGVMRTMISEMIVEKKFQSRAFLLLPMCFNIGVVIGPILGGFLADPIHSFPSLFGAGSAFGGREGVGWMIAFPYALPNLFSGIFIMLSVLAVILGLDETHVALKGKPDRGRSVGKWLFRVVCRRKQEHSYSRISENENDFEDTSIPLEMQPPQPMSTNTQSHTNTNTKPDIEQPPPTSAPNPPKPTPPSTPQVPTRSPFRAILTRNVLLTLLLHHILALHISSFNALIFLFLPSPRPTPQPSHFTLKFTGGLGLTSSKVGLATAIIGLIGFPLQILLYPTLNARLGTLRAYKLFLPFSAVAYTLLPFLVLLPQRGYIVWPALTAVLASQVLSRTFTLTGGVILINNSSPGPQTLGTIHGVAQSVSSAARMVGPTLGGWGLGMGLRNDFVGGVWWGMAVLVVVNWGLLWVVFEGDGMGGRA